jgi:hypothetical protein
LVDLHGNVVLGVRDTGTQVLFGEEGPVGGETIDPSWILYSDGSATGPYRLL